MISAAEDQWTIETLRVHIMALIEAERRRATAEVVALDRLMATARADDQRALMISDELSRKALELAARSVDDRLTKMNEFRGALADAQLAMMPRAEVKLLIDGLLSRMENMQSAVSQLGQVMATLRASLAGQDTGLDEARASADRTRNWLFGAVATGSALLSLYLGIRGTSKPSTTTNNNSPATVATTTTVKVP